jgi:hypothetical protein
MSRNLLQEAIADAKQMRELALLNAKQQIEEAFAPQLSSMLSARLRNEAENIMEDNDGSSEIGSTAVTVKNPGPKAPSAKASDSSHIENPGLEFDTFGEGGTKQPIKEDFEEEPLEEPVDAPVDAPVAEPTDMGMDAGMGDDLGGEPDELDLDAIIRELELDLDGGVEAEPELSQEPAMEPELESFDQAMAGKEVNGAFDGALKEEAEGVHTDGKSPTPVDGVNGGKKVQPGQAVTGTAAETMTEGEELDLDEILREMEAEEQNNSSAQIIATENVELKRSLKEHREVIQFLRSKLNEVNMLNHKLLYTNKLFKSFDLKLEQKMRVVETFDRASTLREVKLVYATLAESLKGGLAGKKPAKALTEGFASKPVSSTAPKTPVLAEGNDLAARFKKLAGIR